ncbi:MAG: SAM-dependent DNA methyltransferase [Candidatus Hydrogenedentes bacterium]|nr:SAM-dependent DNA methyltransferase [Candidatus Hydrogenedentota bacterium]
MTDEVLALIISTDDIEQGRIWDKWGKDIRPDRRVDQILLGELEQLGNWLTDNNVSIQTAHALIGNFVYLRYLRDRNILSNKKLESWDIAPDHLFTRNATLSAFNKVNEHLDEWLNGSVFPLSFHTPDYRAKHVRRVAGIFFGDEVDGQLHLDFKAYDFSSIPTETLSSIYEQFLHATDPKTEKTRGEKAGAHYTPVTLVNLTIDELGKQKPLAEGMKVLDPSCGSGAFLVQCYRRLIEKKRIQGATLTPTLLKKILVEHIFGVELYEDACQIAALSLILTLLDNVQPSDLEWKRHEKFELPDLLGNNIFCADFFDPNSRWAKKSAGLEFDWVIGNPPWKIVKTKSSAEGDLHAWNWMVSPDNKEHPATNNQLAEAFTWKIRDHLGEDGVAGLILPAMTLTKQDLRFRKAFFTENRVFTVVNLANLRKNLFYSKKMRGGKKTSASAPAAVVIFRKGEFRPNDTILTYSPFAIDQIPSRSLAKKIPWSIVINSSDAQELSANDVCDGFHLHWKMAMWGSPRDMRMFERVRGKFSSFSDFCRDHHLSIRKGFELRTEASQEEKEFIPQLVGKNKLISKKLKHCGRIFEFPPDSLSRITSDAAYLRIRGGRAGLDVSTPPHIILDASRQFAVYSDDFIAILHPFIGIGGSSNTVLLKALTVYLNSDFSTYFEFLLSSEWGIKSPRAWKGTLQHLPIPDAISSGETTRSWASLYDRLKESSGSRRALLLRELNNSVSDALSLRESERILVDDMVNSRLKLLDGKVSRELLGQPSPADLKSYLGEFQRVLDSFVGASYRHEIVAYRFKNVAMLQVRMFSGGKKKEPRIVEGNSEMDDALSSTFQRLRQRHSQWLYFDRCLKIYEGSSMYVLKPLQMSQWLRSKALSDADDVIGEYIALQG